VCVCVFHLFIVYGDMEFIIECLAEKCVVGHGKKY